MFLIGPGPARRLGDEDVAIGQHVDPAGMLQTGRERIDFEPRRRDRRLPSAQPLAVGILSVGMLPCGFAAGIVGAAAPRRLVRYASNTKTEPRRGENHAIAIAIHRRIVERRNRNRREQISRRETIERIPGRPPSAATIEPQTRFSPALLPH